MPGVTLPSKPRSLTLKPEGSYPAVQELNSDPCSETVEEDDEDSSSHQKQLFFKDDIIHDNKATFRSPTYFEFIAHSFTRARRLVHSFVLVLKHLHKQHV